MIVFGTLSLPMQSCNLAILHHYCCVAGKGCHAIVILQRLQLCYGVGQFSNWQFGMQMCSAVIVDLRRILELKVRNSILALWIWRKLLTGCQEK